jgi:hypothetical protein
VFINKKCFLLEFKIFFFNTNKVKNKIIPKDKGRNKVYVALAKSKISDNKKNLLSLLKINIPAIIRQIANIKLG